MSKKNILGLDISDHSIEALVLSKQRFGRPKIVAYARTILPRRVMENGVIKNPEKLAAAIGKLLAAGRPQPITASQCVLSLPESQVFTTIFQLPAGLRRSEIKNTVPLKAEEIIPFKSEEVYFDFKLLGAAHGVADIFYAAVPTAVVDGYAAVLRQAGLKPIAFDIESISAARALFAGIKKISGPKLVLDIGARTANLNIVDYAGVRQSHIEKIAGDRFTKAIMINLKLTAKQAEALKSHQGFNPDIKDGKILYILQSEMNLLIAAAKKQIDKYQSQYQRQVDEVLLIGGSSLLPQIEQYFANQLELVTNLGNPVKGIEDPAKILPDKHKLVLFTNVIGLALRGIEKDPIGCDINLLPVPSGHFGELKTGSKRSGWQIYFQLAALCIVLAVMASLLMLNYNLNLYSRLMGTLDKGQSAEVSEKDSISGQPPAVAVEPVMPAVLATSTPALNASTTAATSTAVMATSTPAALPVAAVASLFDVKIKQTSLGYLNVRSGPGLSNNKIGEVSPGKIYPVVAEQNGWYQLKLDNNKTGWVIAIYVEKLN